MSVKSLRESFPIHWLVWHNQYDELKQLLGTLEPHDLEAKDPRGRTPVHLAVTLGHLECARILFRHGANANTENAKYWSVTQEAVTTSDPEMVQLCLQFRDFQRYQRRTEGVPELLQKLREAPDFYVEMKWEFTSWVPLVSRMCPSDVYKVWKSGPNVRIDTTLLGFDNMNWQRGSRSYIFKGNVDHALVMEVDHDLHQVYTETMRVLAEPPDLDLLVPSQDQVAARITTPIVTTYIDTEKIAFERNKSGIWGWRSDKTEAVNGYDCKVFSATNVELVTKTRTEHLTEQDKEKTKKIVRTPLESFLGIAEQTEKSVTSPTSEDGEGATANGEVTTMTNNPTSITPAEYFNSLIDLEGRDIGRPVDQTTKTQKFKANLSLCENYPLSLPEQVIPIIDLMAASNAHFKKLKDFITLQLPAGFPVKIEIPLFHVLNARITFGNIFGVDEKAPGVHMEMPEEAEAEAGAVLPTDCCVVDESCFEAPSTYSVVGDIGRHDAGRMRDEDDELLQFAIQQSLLEPGTENDQVTFWEALNKAGRPGGRSPGAIQAEEERQLQRALEESMRFSAVGGGVPGSTTTPGDGTTSPGDGTAAPDGGTTAPGGGTTAPGGERPVSVSSDPDDDEQFRLVMEMSKQQLEADQARRRQEEEELQMILQLSLTDK